MSNINTGKENLIDYYYNSYVNSNYESLVKLRISPQSSLIEKLYKQAVNFKDEVNSNIEKGIEWTITQVSKLKNKNNFKLRKTLGDLAYSKNFGQIY